MRSRQDPPQELRALMAMQADQATLGQVVALGLSGKAVRRLVGQQVWERTAQGVYTSRPGVTDLRKRAWAGHLAAGDQSAIGGDAALSLVGLTRPVEQVELWVPAGVQRTIDGFVVRRDYLGRLAHTRGLLPLIRPADALVDVGQYLGMEELVGLIAEAARKRTISLEQLTRVVRERTRVHDRRRLLALLADMAGIESTLEFVYRRDVERAHGLPRAKRATSVSVGTRSDVLYEEFGVLVELDGRVGHIDGPFRDMRRDNRHAGSGYFTLRYGNADVRGEACRVGWQVGSALNSRGWTDVATRCPRCRNATDSDFYA